MHAIALSLKKIGTATTVYLDRQSALQAMHRTKVDALFVDREIDPELSLLNTMRAASGNRRALGFAIIPREQAAGGAFRVGGFLNGQAADAATCRESSARRPRVDAERADPILSQVNPHTSDAE
jgi:hypothetical protein